VPGPQIKTFGVVKEICWDPLIAAMLSFYRYIDKKIQPLLTVHKRMDWHRIQTPIRKLEQRSLKSSWIYLFALCKNSVNHFYQFCLLPSSLFSDFSFTRKLIVSKTSRLSYFSDQSSFKQHCPTWLYNCPPLSLLNFNLESGSIILPHNLYLKCVHE